jgi:hypothetical protein
MSYHAVGDTVSVHNTGKLPDLRPLTGRPLKRWNNWVAKRPPVVRDLCERFPPWKYFDMPKTGQVVTVLSYFENGTLKVWVHADRVSTPAVVQFGVFGVPPEDLKEHT